jgi:ABC-type multidrug transport system ATPase subunit
MALMSKSTTHRRDASLGVVPQELVFDPFFNVREAAAYSKSGYFGIQNNGAWIDELLLTVTWVWPTKPTPICANSPVA